MKLLIVTQKVDRTDPILGFFHAWIDAFASRADSVTVIGQQVGMYHLPHNTEVLTLEKEKGRGKVSQVFRFWKLIWKHRSEYDRVLVHMTPIWILIGAPLWIVLRKPMYLWYEIKRGSWKLSVALLLVNKVFAATEHGLPKVAKKQVTTGHGIDIHRFTPSSDKREPGHLVAVGRLTRIKHYEQIIRTLSTLPEECRLTIAGGTVTESDKSYEKELTGLMHSLSVSEQVEIGWIPPEAMPVLLQRADVMLHASQGGLDKVVLQAMACGVPVVSTSEAATSALPSQCTATPETFGQKTQAILDLSESDRETLSNELRGIVEKNHSLDQCIDKLSSEMQ